MSGDFNPISLVTELLKFAVEYHHSEKQLEISAEQLQLSLERNALYKERSWIEWRKFYRDQVNYVINLFAHTEPNDRKPHFARFAS